MVEAKHSLSRTKPRDYRPMLWSLAQLYAKEEAKDRIRASGKRITDYWPRDLAVMATEILMAEPERFIGRAQDIITKEIEEDQRPLRPVARQIAQEISEGNQSSPGSQPGLFSLPRCPVGAQRSLPDWD